MKTYDFICIGIGPFNPGGFNFSQKALKVAAISIEKRAVVPGAFATQAP